MANSITITIISNMTSNYSEGLGNISTVQKVFKNGKTYAIRSKESLKNSIMVQSGFYDDLKVDVDGATQKDVSEEKNATNCRALEGGYMNTKNDTVIRNSSFYVTDAVACAEYVNETRFHNNLYMAQTYAKANDLNLQTEASKCGLMPYQYEYDKSLKQYSFTVDLDMIGTDANYEGQEASAEEKADRVISLLEAIENLSLVVKGNLDNAEPIFAVGGISNRATHYFENVVKVQNNRLVITDSLKERLSGNFKVGFQDGSSIENADEIRESLKPESIGKMFKEIKDDVRKFYGV
ncbi:type I-B CRISPR-associated protein Cas7/Cst2/DevR [Lachnobacterium bovis]|uniref:CRISPR-associated protein Cst2 n=1 Tax=Lachnobacterium bovis TaxID=140626 RepID=A0A1H9S749_9FIRM|nr:type I-B CRISPR-associated protein Cas7/Cst2/DevR [Lachnobacterium bovis]SER80193.1 CRISPR-associated protein Cst2 [Lachnobacterium bovis]